MGFPGVSVSRNKVSSPQTSRVDRQCVPVCCNWGCLLVPSKNPVEKLTQDKIIPAFSTWRLVSWYPSATSLFLKKLYHIVFLFNTNFTTSDLKIKNYRSGSISFIKRTCAQTSPTVLKWWIPISLRPTDYSIPLCCWNRNTSLTALIQVCACVCVCACMCGVMRHSPVSSEGLKRDWIRGRIAFKWGLG